MGNWFSGLPASIRWSFIVAGTLLGTFADKLPVWLQDAGLYAGLAFLAYGMFATLWHFLKSRGVRLLESLLISGGVFLIFAGVMLHVVRTDGVTEASAKPTTEQAAKPADADDTPAPIRRIENMRFAAGQDVKLQNIIQMFEFPGYAGLGSELLQTGPLANSSYAWIHIMQDLDKRVAYNVIEILKDAKAEAAALDVLEKLEPHRTGSTSPIEREFGDDRRILGERLPFAEKVYIYHEPPLTKEQQKRIWEAYKVKGHHVEFRGPEYIAKLWEKHGPRNE